MRLRAHQFIPETKRLVEQLQNQALDTLPKSVREGHQGRLRFLKRCFEHSVRVLTETEHHGGAKIDQDWVMVDVGAIDGEMWDEFEGHSKESAER